MNAHLINGERLLQQGRYKEAADALQQSLAIDPEDPQTFSQLALAFDGQGKNTEALDAARNAVRLAPDHPFTHYVLGFMFLLNGKLIDAERAGQQALQLGPDNPEHYRLLAMIRAEDSNHTAALKLVEQGLSIDPQNSECLNLRSQLLIKLGRRDEAAQASGALLASSPDNARSHANAGWTALHRNQTKEALNHFKESLRLEPGNEWAKAGLAEALKARNPVYRLLLMFFLFMNRLDGRTQFLLIFAGWFVMRAMRSVTKEFPEAAPVLMPLIVLYFVFVALTWVGQPLFDLTLMLSPYGRNALNSLQRWSAMMFGLFLTLALLCCGVVFAGGPATFFGWAAVMGLSAITVPRTFAETRYWRKVVCGVCAGIILVLGGSAVIALQVTGENNPLTVAGAIASGVAFLVFMWLPAISSLKA
ncbi:MAG: tetratricopeptide repeat protein [Planctomycetota bacterium]